MTKKIEKGLTPRQLAVRVAAAINNETLKAREAVAAEIRPIADTLNAARDDLVPMLDEVGDASCVDMAKLLNNSHKALQRRDGKKDGAKGGRPTQELPSDWQTTADECHHLNQKQLAKKLRVSRETLRAARKNRNS